MHSHPFHHCSQHMLSHAFSDCPLAHAATFPPSCHVPPISPINKHPFSFILPHTFQSQTPSTNLQGRAFPINPNTILPYSTTPLPFLHHSPNHSHHQTILRPCATTKRKIRGPKRSYNSSLSCWNV